MGTAKRSSKGPKQDTLLILAAMGAAALYIGSQKKAPAVITQAGGYPIFEFGFPDLGNPFSGATGDSIFNYNIPQAQIPSVPAIDTTGATDTLDSLLSGLPSQGPTLGPFGVDKNLSTVPQVDLPFLDLNPGQLPFLAAIGKISLIESITQSIQSGGVPILKGANPLEALTAVSAVQGAGIAISKSSLLAIGESGAAKGVAGPLLNEAKLGLGITGLSLGLGITGAVAASSAIAFKEQPTAGTAVGFGASAGLLGLEGLTALGAIPAAAIGVPALLLGGAFTLAGITGVGAGLVLNQALIDVGIQKPSAVKTTHDKNLFMPQGGQATMGPFDAKSGDKPGNTTGSVPNKATKSSSKPSAKGNSNTNVMVPNSPLAYKPGPTPDASTIVFYEVAK